ncbi:hypothetical protein D3C80_1329270 [compost metagenome]
MTYIIHLNFWFYPDWQSICCAYIGQHTVKINFTYSAVDSTKVNAIVFNGFSRIFIPWCNSITKNLKEGNCFTDIGNSRLTFEIISLILLNVIRNDLHNFEAISDTSS